MIVLTDGAMNIHTSTFSGIEGELCVARIVYRCTISDYTVMNNRCNYTAIGCKYSC